MVVFLQALDGSLDPKIYVDRGNGFDEAESDFAKAFRNLHLFDQHFGAPNKSASIRIDPSSSAEQLSILGKVRLE